MNTVIELNFIDPVFKYVVDNVYLNIFLLYFRYIKDYEIAEVVFDSYILTLNYFLQITFLILYILKTY